jgi:hypothetical protein
MGLRTQVSSLLRVFTAPFLSTVNLRLEGMEAMLHHIQIQNDQLAHVQTPMLQEILRQNRQITEAQTAMLRDILEQNAHIANTQTALLQAAVYLVETIAQSETGNAESRGSAAGRTDLHAIAARFDELSRQLHESLNAKTKPATSGGAAAESGDRRTGRL